MSAEGDQELTPLEARFHFSVGRIWVRPDLLGRTYPFQRGRFSVAVELPSHRNGFLDGRLEPRSEPFADPRRVRTMVRIAHRQNHRIYIYGIEIIRIKVHFKANLRASRKPPAGESDDPIHPQYNDLLESAFLPARAVAAEVLNWLRILKRQYWLGVSSEPLLLVPNTTSLTDLATGRKLSAGLSQPIPNNATYSEGDVVDFATMDAIRIRMKDQKDQPSPDVLLADALGLVERRRRGELVSLQQAVLLAAIACEVKAKYTLESRTSSTRRVLLAELLENSRGAARLFAGIAKGAVGCSLSEDDPQLYQRLDGLFRLRNRIAHRAEVPPTEDALDAVRAAHGAFQWLEGLPDAPREAEPPNWWAGLEEAGDDG